MGKLKMKKLIQLVMETVQAEPYISSEDNVQCTVCHQDPCLFKNHIAKHHQNHPENMQKKVDNQLRN